MTKPGIFVRIDPAVLDIISNAVPGRSETEKVTNLLHSPFLIKQWVEARLNQLKQEEKLLHNIMQKHAFYTQLEMSHEEAEFLKKSKEIVKANPDFLQGQTRSFNNLFKRHLTPQDYTLMLNGVK